MYTLDISYEYLSYSYVIMYKMVYFIYQHYAFYRLYAMRIALVYKGILGLCNLGLHYRYTRYV